MKKGRACKRKTRNWQASRALVGVEGCSPEAHVKWNGSIGFQHRALARVCIVAFCNALPVRRSYSVTERSFERAPTRFACAGLKRTRVMESAPHSKDCTGSDRAVSHRRSVGPPVANECSLRWWSTSVNAWRPRKVARGVSLSALAADALQSFTVRSSEHDTKWWPAREKASPRTNPECAFADHSADRSARSHLITSPSQPPVTSVVSDAGLFTMQCTPSE
jgi:hypothetical protein